jgi:DNA-binding NarL/FixJ family response regulator
MSTSDAGDVADVTATPVQHGELVKLPHGGPSVAADELQRVAMAAYIVGKDDDCIALLSRAYQELTGRGEGKAAARCAFWIVFSLINNGQWAVAGGWLARARRLIDARDSDCVERGYLLLPEAMQQAASEHFAAVWELARQAAEIGERFADVNLTSLARSVQGIGAIRLGNIADGVALLDEAMLAVTTDDVSPVVATTVYCGLIEACLSIFDLRRAREWTEALTIWYASHPEVRLNRGRCMVYRAEILQQNGAWAAALLEAQRACAQLFRNSAQPIAGAAHYVRAEIHRLRGQSELAAEAYRQASARGHEPQPGLALLRLAQGDLSTARAAIRRAVAESPRRLNRPKLLAANIEIALGAGDVSEVRPLLAELEAIADDVGTPYLHAMAHQAAGAVQLADENPVGALDSLRRAWMTWQALDVPYEAARCRSLLSVACRGLGDDDTAKLERDAAMSIFQRLGAAIDAHLKPTVVDRVDTPDGGLTARELDVLRLVTTGMTNRGIANQLGVSEKTIARHLSNILSKLGLRSRSAATAYAYEHGLI